MLYYLLYYLFLMLIYLLFEEVGLLNADGAPYRLAVLEKDQGRH